MLPQHGCFRPSRPRRAKDGPLPEQNVLENTAAGEIAFAGVERKEAIVTCRRCHGLMVMDDSVDMDERDGLSDVKAWRCVQCGEWIDNVILRNRLIQQGTLAREPITSGDPL